MSTTTKHADLLNALDEMQRSPVYSLRRGALRQAEQLIAEQEQKIDRLKESHDDLLAACEDSAILLREAACKIENQNPELGYELHNQANATYAAIAKARGEA